MAYKVYVISSYIICTIWYIVWMMVKSGGIYDVYTHVCMSFKRYISVYNACYNDL